MPGVGLAAMTGMLGNTMAGAMTTGMAGMAGIAMRIAMPTMPTGMPEGMPEGMPGNDGDGKFETLWRGVMVVMGGGMEMDDAVSHLPYLDATVREGFRLSAPLAVPLERVVPPSRAYLVE